MINTSTNQPYLTVRDLIERLSQPHIDPSAKVCWLNNLAQPMFPGDIKQVHLTTPGANSQIRCALFLID